MAEKKPSEVLGGWNQQVAEQLGQIADNTGGEGTAQAGSEKRPSDVLGGWYKEVSDLLDDIATNTEGGGAEPYVLPTMSPTTKGGATVGEGLTMDGTALSVDFTEVASVDALEEATALSPTGGIVSTQDGLAISPTQQTTGTIDGALLELTAKGHAEQDGTPTPDNPVEIVTVTGHEVTGNEGRFVSLERRDSQGTLLDTTPIPLPSRGWVAGLPDGTADELSVDGAGKVMWELKTGREQYSSTEMTFTENKYVVPKKSVNAYMSWSYPKICTIVPPISAASNANRVYFDTRYNSKLETYEGEFELYWKLQTPVTEDCGYIDLPDTQDCVLSIPELDALGVRYTIGDGAEIARQWHERNESEVAAATTKALGNVAPVEGDTASANYAVGDYLVHDGTLCKVTSAIATGETITLGINVTATTVMAEILALQTQGE